MFKPDNLVFPCKLDIYPPFPWFFSLVVVSKHVYMKVPRMHNGFVVKSPIIKIFCTSTYCVILTYFCSLSHLSSISSKDPSPCSRVKCPFYGTCRVKEDGTPHCACPISCLDNYRPVCGSDGKSYLNECFLRSNACFLQKRITVLYNGLCSKLVGLSSFNQHFC